MHRGHSGHGRCLSQNGGEYNKKNNEQRCHWQRNGLVWKQWIEGGHWIKGTEQTRILNLEERQYLHDIVPITQTKMFRLLKKLDAHEKRPGSWTWVVLTDDLRAKVGKRLKGAEQDQVFFRSYRVHPIGSEMRTSRSPAERRCGDP